MKQHTLSRWLKIILLGVSVCAALFYAILLPSFGMNIMADNPEFVYCFWPWLIFLELTAVPCVISAVLAWRIFSAIGQDQSFTMKNANRMALIAKLAAGDGAYFLLGNIVFFLLSMSHPALFILAMLVVFAAVTVAVLCAALAHLIRRAAELQDQSDFTI